MLENSFSEPAPTSHERFLNMFSLKLGEAAYRQFLQNGRGFFVVHEADLSVLIASASINVQIKADYLAEVNGIQMEKWEGSFEERMVVEYNPEREFLVAILGRTGHDLYRILPSIAPMVLYRRRLN